MQSNIRVQYVRVLFNCKVNINLHYDKASCKAVSIINWMERDIKSWIGEETAHLFSMLLTLYPEYYNQVCMLHLKHVQRKKAELLKSLKRCPVGNGRMNGELFNQEKRILQWHMMVDFKHFKTAT